MGNQPVNSQTMGNTSVFQKGQFWWSQSSQGLLTQVIPPKSALSAPLSSMIYLWYSWWYSTASKSMEKLHRLAASYYQSHIFPCYPEINPKMPSKIKKESRSKPPLALYGSDVQVHHGSHGRRNTTCTGVASTGPMARPDWSEIVTVPW